MEEKLDAQSVLSSLMRHVWVRRNWEPWAAQKIYQENPDMTERKEKNLADPKIQKKNLSDLMLGAKEKKVAEEDENWWW